MDRMRTWVLGAAVAGALLGCGGREVRPAMDADAQTAATPPVVRETRHAGEDDLLSAGLGLAGLQSPQPPAFAQPEAPTTAELRRRAIWANWRGIADLAPGGGFGEVYGRVPAVPGREFHTLLTLPGATQPHRVLLQLPDAFDPTQGCLVVTASSGSRGVYGAIALAGGWGLPRGCAVVYTDKGAGTDWFDVASGQGVRLDGSPGVPEDGLAFTPPLSAEADPAPRVLTKHAHSGDNPEADWGRHLQQAAGFAQDILQREHGLARAQLRIIAVGVSNGGGAVLQGAALEADWIDAAVAVSPNVWPAQAGRALYDYTTEAAIWMPCALSAAAFDGEPLARPGGQPLPAWTARCASLAAAGLVQGGTPAEQADDALRRLRASGWTDAALVAGTMSVALDLWRAVAVGYAPAYLRTGPADMPCGYAYVVAGADGAPRAATPAERAAWWSDASGIPPGAGVVIAEATTDPVDPALPGLQCLRGLWDGTDERAARLRAGAEATRAGLPRAGLPVVVLHGDDDGLIPEAFSSGAYALWLAQEQRPLHYWRIAHAQHFDAFLGLPALGARYLPLMPYAYDALDGVWSHLVDGTPLPGSRRIEGAPRGTAPLQRTHLGL